MYLWVTVSERIFNRLLKHLKDYETIVTFPSMAEVALGSFSIHGKFHSTGRVVIRNKYCLTKGLLWHSNTVVSTACYGIATTEEPLLSETPDSVEWGLVPLEELGMCAFISPRWTVKWLRLEQSAWLRILAPKMIFMWYQERCQPGIPSELYVQTSSSV